MVASYLQNFNTQKGGKQAKKISTRKTVDIPSNNCGFKILTFVIIAQLFLKIKCLLKKMTKEEFKNRWNYLFKHDHEGAYKNLIFLIICGNRVSPHEHSEETLKKNLERIREQRRAKGVLV